MSNILNDTEYEEKIIEKVIENPMYIMAINLTNEIAIKAINANPKVIEYIPTEKITREMALLAVKKDSELLKSIPKSLLTKNFYEQANRYIKSLFDLFYKKLF